MMYKPAVPKPQAVNILVPSVHGRLLHGVFLSRCDTLRGRLRPVPGGRRAGRRLPSRAIPSFVSINVRRQRVGAGK